MLLWHSKMVRVDFDRGIEVARLPSRVCVYPSTQKKIGYMSRYCYGYCTVCGEFRCLCHPAAALCFSSVYISKPKITHAEETTSTRPHRRLQPRRLSVDVSIVHTWYVGTTAANTRSTGRTAGTPSVAPLKMASQSLCLVFHAVKRGRDGDLDRTSRLFFPAHVFRLLPHGCMDNGYPSTNANDGDAQSEASGRKGEWRGT